MINKSGLYPQGHAVLVQAYEPEVEKFQTSLIIPDSVRQSFSVLENRVVVVALGLEAWADERGPRASPGDIVMVTKHAGFVATGADGEMYRLVNDRDIFCKLDRKLFEAARERAA